MRSVLRQDDNFVTSTITYQGYDRLPTSMSSFVHERRPWTNDDPATSKGSTYHDINPQSNKLCSDHILQPLPVVLFHPQQCIVSLREESQPFAKEGSLKKTVHGHWGSVPGIKLFLTLPLRLQRINPHNRPRFVRESVFGVSQQLVLRKCDVVHEEEFVPEGHFVSSRHRHRDGLADVPHRTGAHAHVALVEDGRRFVFIPFTDEVDDVVELEDPFEKRPVVDAREGRGAVGPLDRVAKVVFRLDVGDGQVRQGSNLRPARVDPKRRRDNVRDPGREDGVDELDLSRRLVAVQQAHDRVVALEAFRETRGGRVVSLYDVDDDDGTVFGVVRVGGVGGVSPSSSSLDDDGSFEFFSLGRRSSHEGDLEPCCHEGRDDVFSEIAVGLIFDFRQLRISSWVFSFSLLGSNR